MKLIRSLAAVLALVSSLVLAQSTGINGGGPNGANYSTYTGPVTPGDCVKWLTVNGGQGDAGAPCGSGGGGSSAITCTTACSALTLAVGQELWMYKGTATNYTTQVGTGDPDLQVTGVPVGDYFVTAMLNVTGPASGTLQGNFLDAGTTNGASQCQLMLVGGSMVQTGINTGTFPYSSVGQTGVTGVSVYTCSLLQVSAISNKFQFFFFNSAASQTSTVQAGSWIRVERIL